MTWASIRTWSERVAWSCALCFVLNLASCTALNDGPEHSPVQNGISLFVVGLGIIAVAVRGRAADEHDGTHSHGPA